MWGFLAGYAMGRRPRVLAWSLFVLVFFGAAGMLGDMMPGMQWVQLLVVLGVFGAAYAMRLNARWTAEWEAQDREYAAAVWHQQQLDLAAWQAEGTRLAALEQLRRNEFDRFEWWRAWAEWNRVGRPDAQVFDYVDSPSWISGCSPRDRDRSRSSRLL